MITSEKKTTRRGCLHTLGIGVLIFLGTCLLCEIWGVLFPNRKYYAPEQFPHTDLVFRASEKLGFVNADGSGLTMVPFQIAYTDFVTVWGKPIITGDNEYLIVTFISYYHGPGKIFIARRGGVARDCGWYGIAQLAADGYHILVGTLNHQEQYLPEDCGTGNAPERVIETTTLGTLSPDKQYLAGTEYDEQGHQARNLIIQNLKTGEKRFIGEGDFPVWSRDGQWLAYTGVDGIYIVQNSPNAKPRRLVVLESPNPPINSPVYSDVPSIGYYPPIASWSPDGQWLAYHVYSRTPVASETGEWYKHYSIFKVNVKTGETIKLLDGGHSPFWRWPAKPTGEQK
jgi:hypothetical protein